MNIDSQIERIKKQQPIEALSHPERLQVLARAVYLFRKFVSPISNPVELERNLSRIALLCRLEADPDAYAMILAARGASMLEAAIKPGPWDDFARACGLDISSGSKTTLGEKSGRYSMVEDLRDDNDAGSFHIVFKGRMVTIHGGSRDGRLETESFAEACAAIDLLNIRGASNQRNVELEYGAASGEEDIEIFDTVHDPWRPTQVFSQKLKRHPAAIIEPSTLAATSYPDPTYKPMLPAEAIERGVISDAQFEAIVYGLQVTTTYLPGSPNGPHGVQMKGGFILGDGTGVGKTNEFCGMIMDQWLRGQSRHVIVVERGKHVKHIMDAWQMIGGDPRVIMYQGDRAAGEALPSRDGIMVTTYALIRDDRRYQMLMDWANDRGPLEGLLVFDEAHNMRNAIEDLHDEGAGRRNQSQQGMRGVQIQEELPRAGVIYASATMATDVYNLGYAIRLGLWGHNAAFSSSAAFINQMHSLDEAALEQICIDLKAAGRYCSRTLSFDGVEYEEVEHRLTPRQKTRFDETVRGWQTYHKMNQAAMKACCRDKSANAYATGTYALAQRSTVETLLTNFNVETMIRDIHEELAKGNAPVIQISMTGEARTRRIVGDRTYLTLEDYRENKMRDYIEHSFPIHYRHKVDGKWEVILDANGNGTVCPEAQKIRDDALKLSESIAIDMNALDRLYLEFGEDQIAEMTGRSARMLPVHEGGKHVGWKVEERHEASAVGDVDAFQNGRKSILIFSLGAGGTGLSYHAAKDANNKKRRVHYLLELGRRAESAVQGIGRTHRSGQIMPPVVKMVMSDIPAHMIYASKTLAKIAKMGALSRGHQHATTNAIFDQRIPLHSSYAALGWAHVLDDIRNERLEGITINTLAEDLHLEKLEDFSTVLGRLAILTDGDQRALMSQLHKRTEEAIANAVRNGTYNQGLETIRGNSIEIRDESEILNSNGSKTRYYRLRRHEVIERTPFSRAARILAGSKSKKNVRAVFMRHKVNGRIALGVTRSDGGSFVDITTPGGSTVRTIDAIRQEPWRVVEDLQEAERHWELESENLDMQEYTEMHMLSGSLLYNWDKLPKSGIGLNRCKTDDGKVIVGRIVNKHQIRDTLQKLGMTSSYRPAQIAKMLKEVDSGATIDLDNGWSIDMPAGASDYRLNVPDGEQTGQTRNMLTSMGVRAINTPLGMEFEIPRTEAVEVMQQLAIGSDMTMTSAANNNSTVALAAMLEFPA